MFHRWSAYAFFVLALMHTFPFIVYHIRFHDMMMHVQMSVLFYWTGIVALVFQAWLTFASHSVIRYVCRKPKATQLTLLGTSGTSSSKRRTSSLPSYLSSFSSGTAITRSRHGTNPSRQIPYVLLTVRHYFIATAAVYVPCFVYPWLRTLFEYGFQSALLSVEDNGFTRITIPANFHWKPGQHCFLRFTSFGFVRALSAHPFTICSLPSRQPGEESQLVFYIRHQGGFTAQLYEYALQHPGASLPVLVDGPYGGVNMQPYIDSDHLVVIAGGSGAGWTLPFIEHFACLGQVRKETSGDDDAEKGKACVPASLRVILATRETNSCAWYTHAVKTLLAKHTRVPVRVEVYLTGEAVQGSDSSEEVAKSATVSEPERSISEESTDGLSIEEFSGRPLLATTVRKAADAAGRESLGVFVCGPVTMQNDVRNAVADANIDALKGKSGGVYLHCEHFSWA